MSRGRAFCRGIAEVFTPPDERGAQELGEIAGVILVCCAITAVLYVVLS